MEAGVPFSIFLNAFALVPTLVAQAHDDATLPWLVAVTSDPAQRTESERLLVSLGLPSPEALAPRPETCEPLTEARAAVLCHALSFGSLYERLNAIYVLRTHIVYGSPHSDEGALAPATLDALCLAALTRIFVSPPADALPSHQLSDEQLHEVVTDHLRLLPRSASIYDATRAMLGCLQMIALDAIAHLLSKLTLGEDSDAAAAALRRIFQLKLHTDTLSVARYGPEQGFAQRPQHQRTVALLTLQQIVYSSQAVQPRLKELGKLQDDCRAVALEALADPRSGHHVRAAATFLLAYVVGRLQDKEEAVAAGAMQHLVDMYSAADLYTRSASAEALIAAGRISSGARDAAMIAPHTTHLFSELQRFATQPWLPFLQDRGEDWEEANSLSRVLVALAQIAPYIEFRPLFESAENAEALEAVMEGLRESPVEQLASDIAKLLVLLEQAPTPLGSHPRDDLCVPGSDPEAVPEGNRCNGCAARGERFKICSACRTVYYCSQECLRAHWEQHKPACRAAVAVLQHVRLVTKTDPSERELQEVAAKLHQLEAATKPDTPE